MTLPLWTALPPRLDHLLQRLVDVREYPVSGPSRAICHLRLIGLHAPDPHDWRLWRTGAFMASYANRVFKWPVYLRRCVGCGAVEVRKEGDSRYIASARRGRSGVMRTPGPADVLLGWYQTHDKES